MPSSRSAGSSSIAGRPGGQLPGRRPRAIDADFIAKLKIVEEESDEGGFWIDRLFDARLPETLHAEARALQQHFDEITRMTVASLKTARPRLRSSALSDGAQRRTTGYEFRTKCGGESA